MTIFSSQMQSVRIASQRKRRHPSKYVSFSNAPPPQKKSVEDQCQVTGMTSMNQTAESVRPETIGDNPSLSSCYKTRGS